MSYPIDYRGIIALKTVIDFQHFEKAAQKLNITQSAVTQRIKTLEKSFGEPLLIRSLPYKATKLGEVLLNHQRRVEFLEGSLYEKVEIERLKAKFSIAINHDALETWVIETIVGIPAFQTFHLEVITEDQELTLDLLENARVLACISTNHKRMSGCDSAFLGEFEYVLVCSSQFKEKYFKNDRSLKDNLLDSPYLSFNYKDQLNQVYMDRMFNCELNADNTHIIPSVKGFREMTLAGFGWALIPKIDILDCLEDGRLIILESKKTWRMPLYWHYWQLPDRKYQRLNQLFIEKAQKRLYLK